MFPLPTEASYHGSSPLTRVHHQRCNYSSRQIAAGVRRGESERRVEPCVTLICTLDYNRVRGNMHGLELTFNIQVSPGRGARFAVIKARSDA